MTAQENAKKYFERFSKLKRTAAAMTDLIASVDDLERKTAGSQSAKGLLDPFGPKFDEARRSSQRPR